MRYNFRYRILCINRNKKKKNNGYGMSSYCVLIMHVIFGPLWSTLLFKPFDDQTVFKHSNTGLVRYLDPHFTKVNQTYGNFKLYPNFIAKMLIY